MSYTAVRMTATCAISPHITLDSLIQGIVDYLGNHEDELQAFTWLADMEPSEVFDEIKKYPDLEGTELTIKYDSEGYYTEGADSEVAEFLTQHVSFLMTSSFMEVTWISEDSRDGTAVNHYHLGQGGVLEELKPSGKLDLTEQIAGILWPKDEAAPQASAATLKEIEELYAALRPDLILSNEKPPCDSDS